MLSKILNLIIMNNRKPSLKEGITPNYPLTQTAIDNSQVAPYKGQFESPADQKKAEILHTKEIAKNHLIENIAFLCNDDKIPAEMRKTLNGINKLAGKAKSEAIEKFFKIKENYQAILLLTMVENSKSKDNQPKQFELSCAGLDQSQLDKLSAEDNANAKSIKDSIERLKAKGVDVQLITDTMEEILGIGALDLMTSGKTYDNASKIAIIGSFATAINLGLLSMPATAAAKAVTAIPTTGAFINLVPTIGNAAITGTIKSLLGSVAYGMNGTASILPILSQFIFVTTNSGIALTGPAAILFLGAGTYKMADAGYFEIKQKEPSKIAIEVATKIACYVPLMTLSGFERTAEVCKQAIALLEAHY
jgi:hypothetical protein